MEKRVAGVLLEEAPGWAMVMSGMGGRLVYWVETGLYGAWGWLGSTC